MRFLSDVRKLRAKSIHTLGINSSSVDGTIYFGWWVFLDSVSSISVTPILHKVYLGSCFSSFLNLGGI